MLKIISLGIESILNWCILKQPNNKVTEKSSLFGCFEFDQYSLDGAVVDWDADHNLFIAVFHPNVTVSGQSDAILVHLKPKHRCDGDLMALIMNRADLLTLLQVNWHSVAYSVNSFWMDRLISISFDSASATRSVSLRVRLSNFCILWKLDRSSDCFGWLSAANSNVSDELLMNSISTVDSPVQLASNTR